MFPVLAMHDTSDVYLAYSVLFGNFGLGHTVCVKGANLDYIGLSEFGLPMPHTMSMSPLSVHIGNIISRCTREQMHRIRTGRIVTVVTNQLTFWNGATMQDIANFGSTIAFPIHCESAITFVIYGANPFPAIIRIAAATRIFPKTFIDWARWMLLHAPPVSVNKSRWLALFYSKRLAGAFGNWCVLIATTLTFSIGLEQSIHGYPGGLRRLNACMMIADKANGLTFNVPVTLVCSLRNWCRQAATTFTQLIKIKLGLGKFWGMILHVFSASNATDHARELQLAWHFSLVRTPVILPYKGALANV